MAPGGKANREAKRQRREAALAARREEQRRLQARRRRRTLAVYGGIALVVLAGVGLLALSALRPQSSIFGAIGGFGKPSGLEGVQVFGDQGAAHITLGQAHPSYNSNPPTSGWHTPFTAPWGVHRTSIADEIIVHNLEHGGIWISYRDASDTALVEKLEALVSRYRSKVILTPRSINDSRIAVAAWTRLLKLEEYDEQKIVAFINAFKNKGPEMVPD
ncbi:MAG: DUF3105 domain-containing protein [Armatimonadota bacterium]|nr:DUF3105 domain-containing protein [Armatimonadota bacterium]MDR7519367.1 DUF3105 domain-containing protein [Armatimonadota bacterium]MDR7549510.1 DUF3105 domain-containing protein [Armatimonadota bacterium]